MELKLASGVKVGVTDDEGNKVLRFNEPVRAVALTPEEASKIGVSLNRSKRLRVLPTLSDLIESGFLDKPKSFPEIRKEMIKLNPSVKASSLTMALVLMTQKRILTRSGKPGSYTYRLS
jgi:hypothetical protein